MTRHYFADLDINNNDILNSNLSGGGGGGTTTGASVSLSADVTSLADVTLNTITWNTEDIDDATYFDVGNPTRLTVSETGWYSITGVIKTLDLTNPTGYISLLIRSNGSTALTESREFLDYTGTTPHFQNISTIAYLTSGDYVELAEFHELGTTISIDDVLSSFNISSLVSGGSGSGGGGFTQLTNVRMSTNQNITASTVTVLEFDTADLNDGNYDDTTNYEYTVPETGTYFISAGVRTNAASGLAGTRLDCFLYVNSSADSGWNGERIENNGEDTHVFIAFPITLTQNDTVSIAVFSTQAVTIEAGANDLFTYFNIWRIGEGGGGSNEGAAISRTTDFAIPVSTLTAVEWEDEDKDDNGYVDLGANNTRITIPETGTYIVHAQLQITTTSVANEIRTARIRLNGTTLLGRQDYAAIANGTASTTVQVTYIGNLSANDYLEVVTFTNEASKNVLASSSYFTIEKIPSGGGSGGSSPLTTKGDIFTYDTGDQRLPVGTDGQILSANSATATGLEWIANTGGGASSVRVFDTFTDTNGTLITAHTADLDDTSGGVVEITRGGTALTPGSTDIQSNSASLNLDNHGFGYDMGSTEGSISLRYTYTAGDKWVALMGRWVDNNNYIELQIRPSIGDIVPIIRIGGVETFPTPTTFSWSTGAVYSISLEIKGALVRGTVTRDDNANAAVVATYHLTDVASMSGTTFGVLRSSNAGNAPLIESLGIEAG